jgi:competence protein ComEC
VVIREKIILFAPLALFLLFILVNGVVWRTVFLREHTHPLRVYFLDVGQGDAIFIESPHGIRVLVDAGAGGAVLRALGSVLPFGETRVDAVVATHPDLDHIGGFPSFLQKYQVGSAFISSVEDDGADARAFEASLVAEGAQKYTPYAGEVLVLEDGVMLSFLFPVVNMAHAETNTASLVTRLAFGDTSFLLMGDAPATIEQFLVSRYEARLASTVLKLGHHGAKTSSSEVFLGTVEPSSAVVSAGCENRYGHPSEEVLARLRERGIRIQNTCKDGTILFESDGKQVLQKTSP